ncbi:MAG: hypothetical protein UZ02_AOB001001555 [Nitrosomonas europaea]|nr:MAG: hypothetical protein UZ02_AOB001001555 [Nitrosomonas europaea]
MGLKFKRQKPIGPYIVDFVCFEPRLVVELDGGQHVDQVAYDRKRDALLQAQGFAVLRFWNNQALGETEAVLEAIRLKVLTLTLDRSTLSPNPSPASGEGSKTRKKRNERNRISQPRRIRAGTRSRLECRNDQNLFKISIKGRSVRQNRTTQAKRSEQP